MSKVTITEIGKRKIANATIKEPLKIKNFAIGDGDPQEHNSGSRDLANRKYTSIINDKYNKDNNAIIECVLRANADIKEGFYITEIGLFDEVGDLIAIADLPKHYRPGSNETATEYVYTVNLTVSETTDITISINESVFVTKEALDREIIQRNEADKKLETLMKAEDSKIAEQVTNQFRKLLKGQIGSIIAYPYTIFSTAFLNDSLYELLPCDGRTLKILDYPDLYNVIGKVWNDLGTTQLLFNLPKTTDRVLRNIGTLNSTTTQEDALQKATFEISASTVADSSSHYPYMLNVKSAAKTTNNVSVKDMALEHNAQGSISAHGPHGDGDAPHYTEITIGTANETRVKSLSVQYYIVAKLKI